MSKAVAKNESKLPAAMMQDMAADAGKGMENADKETYAIPFLSLLQGLSPQIETVDDAKPGLFINTITNECMKEVLVVPVAFQRRFLRWAPRAQGGGYKGEYSPIEVETGKLEGLSNQNGYLMMDVDGEPFDKDGHPKFDILSDTRNHFVLMLSESGTWQPALISMSSTQVKKSKRWMSRINGIELEGANGKFTPPSFSHIYRMKALKEENAKGSWWGFDIDMEKMVDDEELYMKAKAFHEQVQSGDIEIQEPVDESAGGGEGSDKSF